MTNLVRWEPFRDLVSLREAMDRLFEESFVRPQTDWPAPIEAGALAVDVYETEDAVVVKSAIPGVKPEEKVEEENYVRREMRYGSFSRTLAVPTAVMADKAEADFENGVLTLTLPKAEEVKPKAIQIKAK